MSETEEEREDERRRVQNFISALVPYGYLDVARTVNLLKEYGLTEGEGAEVIEQFCEDTGTPLIKDGLMVDTTYIIYEHILQMARNEIMEKTGKDILNDTEEQVYAYGNYCCSGFGYGEEEIREIKAIIKGVPLEEFSELTRKFLEEIEAV